MNEQRFVVTELTGYPFKSQSARARIKAQLQTDVTVRDSYYCYRAVYRQPAPRGRGPQSLERRRKRCHDLARWLNAIEQFEQWAATQ
jgi:hypothetical protein